MCRSSALRFLLFSCFLISLTTSAQDSSQSRERHKGTGPRASAANYRSHVEKEGFALGAELLSKKEVSTMFAADVNRCCLVVQVAVYPGNAEPVDLSVFDFSLVEVKTDKPGHPETPTTVAAKLENQKNPPSGVGVTTSGGVGYESGTYIDPVTGQPVHVHGVSTSAGVGVPTGNSTPASIADAIEKLLSESFM